MNAPLFDAKQVRRALEHELLDLCFEFLGFFA